MSAWRRLRWHFVTLRELADEMKAQSLRDIAAALAGAGYINERGALHSAKSVASMLN
jgi:hypothetical protein